MTYFLDEFKEYDCNECSIPKGSIIGIYGQFYKLSNWYVYDYYNKNITIVKLDDNHKLSDKPLILMVSTEDLDYYIIDWNADYIQISKDYIANFYRFTQPLYKVRYGDIINLSDYKDKYSLFFVMNFDPVTNTYMILSMDQNKKKQYYSLNIGLCNYYILSRKELRLNIINKSKEFTKKYIIDCYETLDIIDEDICIRNKINYLMEKSYATNLISLSTGFLNGSLETVKNDLENYDNKMDTFQFEINNDNDEWKQIFTKKNNEIGQDENYIHKLNFEEKVSIDTNNLEQINLSNVKCPIIKIYSAYDDGEMYTDDIDKYITLPRKEEQNFIEFSYSSEEYEYRNKVNYLDPIQHYVDNDDSNVYPVFENYLNSYQSKEEDQNENNYYSDDVYSSENSYDDNEEISYCSDRYIYNNKYDADYSYEPCNQSSSQSELYQYNSVYPYDYSENIEEDDYKIETVKNTELIPISKNQTTFDYDYINTLFENYYNGNEHSKETALDTNKLNNNNEDIYCDMPDLIPIHDYIQDYCRSYISNNFVNSEMIIEIPANFENFVNNQKLLEFHKTPDPIMQENKIIETNEEINISSANELEEEYIDISINEVEPYDKNAGSCTMM
jgi:hypothetical protein